MPILIELWVNPCSVFHTVDTMLADAVGRAQISVIGGLLLCGPIGPIFTQSQHNIFEIRSIGSRLSIDGLKELRITVLFA